MAGAAGLLSVTGVLAAAATASAGTAAPGSSKTITVKYPVNGSTYLKKVQATAKLGPGTLTSKVNLDTGKLTASLKLPDATVSFKQAGVVPVTATTEFVQDGKTTGQVNTKTGGVTTTSKVTLKLVSLTMAGVPVPVPSGCESGSPASVKLRSEKGFSIIKGGKVAGTYTIPKFAHCGLLTPLLNITIPGSGNTITLKLRAAKLA
ncbi:MAG TPA: hypothetical protein VGG25_30750 [Streptosporangiaceae bacterium]|jgi:hypothetical protein